MSPFSSAALSKKVRKEAPSVRQEKGNQPRSAFPKHRLFPPQVKKQKIKKIKNKKIKIEANLARVLFPPSEPKVHGQSSPMCLLHPPRSGSLIFQHYKLRASSHLKRAQNVKKETLPEGGRGDPRARRLCLSPGCPTAKSAARVLFDPPSKPLHHHHRHHLPTQQVRRLRFIHLDASSHVLAAGSMTRSQCAGARGPRAARGQQPARCTVPLFGFSPPAAAAIPAEPPAS